MSKAGTASTYPMMPHHFIGTSLDVVDLTSACIVLWPRCDTGQQTRLLRVGNSLACTESVFRNQTLPDNSIARPRGVVFVFNLPDPCTYRRPPSPELAAPRLLNYRGFQGLYATAVSFLEADMA